MPPMACIWYFGLHCFVNALSARHLSKMPLTNVGGIFHLQHAPILPTFSIRSGHNWFTHKMFTNRWLWLTFVLVTALTLLVLLLPGMQSLFKLAPMTSGQWWTVIGLSFGVLALSELFKLFTRKKGR